MAEGFTKRQLAQLQTMVKDSVKTSVSNMNASMDTIQGPLERISKTIGEINQLQKDLARVGVDFTSRFHDSADAAEGFSLAIQNVAEASGKFFGSVEPGINAFKSLATNMTSFVALGEEAQVNITDLTSKMQYLGFEADALASIMDTQAMAFGKTEKQIQNFAKVMSRASRELYIEPRKMLENFDMAQQNFAYNAEKTLDVFLRMQKESRKTGVEFSTMARAFGSEMDTFQGVTRIAGQLNAILGQSVFNPLQLLAMDEADRMQTIRQGLGGQAFVQSALNDPNRKFELRSLAKTLGMDPLQFRRLLTEGDPGSLKAKTGSRIDSRFEAGIGKAAGDNLGRLAEATSYTQDEMELLADTIRNLRSGSENYMIGLNNQLMIPAMETLRTVAKSAGVNEKLIEKIGFSADLLEKAVIGVLAGDVSKDETNITPVLQFRYGAGSRSDINAIKAPSQAKGTLNAAKDTVKAATEMINAGLSAAGYDEQPEIAQMLTPILLSQVLRKASDATGTGYTGQAAAGLAFNQNSEAMQKYITEMVDSIPSLPGLGGGTASGYIQKVIAALGINTGTPGSGGPSPQLGPMGAINLNQGGPNELDTYRDLTLKTIKDVLNEDFKENFRTWLIKFIHTI